MSRKLVKPAEEKAQARESIRLSGRNIYTDKQGRMIYYDWVTPAFIKRLNAPVPSSWRQPEIGRAHV